jgi:hypothetical protein
MKAERMAKQRVVYQLKIRLQGTKPAIWRRVQVWEEMTLPQLHTVFQIVMGWEDCHLHEFKIGGRAYGVPDPVMDPENEHQADEERVRLNEVVGPVGSSFEYLYDFGDDWFHAVLVEGILLAEDGVQYPRCLAGERRGPPEDIGGPMGFDEYLETIANESHPNHEYMLEWRGPFDAESFLLDEINQDLQKAFGPGRRRPGTRKKRTGASA